jgi:glutaredoxin 3
MLDIKIYKTTICPYCVKAKALLIKKGVAENITEIDISNNAELKQEMLNASGGRMTVPQIFINEKHIGGCDDLYALDAKGELDALLG